MNASGMPVQSPDDCKSCPLFCSQCGYDLRMLAPEGLCPECAHPVAASVRSPLPFFVRPARVRLALGATAVAALLCIGALLLTWLYLRYGYPLSRSNPAVFTAALNRTIWRACLAGSTAGGVARYAAVLILFRAMRRPGRFSAADLIPALVFGAAVMALVFSYSLSGLLTPRSKAFDDLVRMHDAFAPAVLWLASLIAWIRFRRLINRNSGRALALPTHIAITATTLLLTSSFIYFVAAACDPNWVVWSLSALWGNRFLTWSANGLIETLLEVLYLLALLMLIRRLRSAESFDPDCA